MSAGRKTAVSMLCTIAVFAVFTAAVHSGFFSVIETELYQPLLLKSIREKVGLLAEAHDEYICGLVKAFSGFLNSEEIRLCTRSVQTEAMAGKIQARTDGLFSNVPALAAFRIIASDGRHILFSTDGGDIAEYGGPVPAYGEYSGPSFVPPDRTSDGAPMMTLDTAGGKLLFALPFYDDTMAYSGTALFDTALSGYERFLLEKNLISVSDSGILIPLSSRSAAGKRYGFIFGMPYTEGRQIAAEIAEIWERPYLPVEKLHGPGAERWLLFSAAGSSAVCIGWAYPEGLFLIPPLLRIAFSASVFMSLFLFFFLIMNIRQDETSGTCCRREASGVLKKSWPEIPPAFKEQDRAGNASDDGKTEDSGFGVLEPADIDAAVSESGSADTLFEDAYSVGMDELPHLGDTVMIYDDTDRLMNFTVEKPDFSAADDAEPDSAEAEEALYVDAGGNAMFCGFPTGGIFCADTAAELPCIENKIGEKKNVSEAIIECDGIYVIPDNLDFSGIIQDTDFKNLVDSIL